MLYNQKRRIIFIISASHSGSTLLCKLLGQHTDIFSGSELINYNNESVNSDTSYCSCGKVYHNCGFWQNIAGDIDIDDNLYIFNEIKKNKNVFEIINLILTILFNKKFKLNNNKTITKYESLYNKIFEQSGKSIIVDSSKNFFNALILASQNNYIYNFIFLTRDGRAVINSSLKDYYFVRSLNKKFIRNKPNISHAINHWKKQNILGLVLIFFRHKNSIKIKHEDVINSNENIVKNIFEKFDIKFEPNLAELSKQDHMFGGNSSRLNAKRIEKKDLEKWKTSFSPEQKNYVNKKTRFINKLLGY